MIAYRFVQESNFQERRVVVRGLDKSRNSVEKDTQGTGGERTSSWFDKKRVYTILCLLINSVKNQHLEGLKPDKGLGDLFEA